VGGVGTGRIMSTFVEPTTRPNLRSPFLPCAVDCIDDCVDDCVDDCIDEIPAQAFPNSATNTTNTNK